MIKLKRLIFKILFPHTAVILLLIPVSAVMLLYAFTEKKLVSAVQYAAYGLSAYTMTVLCAKAPVLYKKARAIKPVSYTHLENAKIFYLRNSIRLLQTRRGYATLPT